MFKRSVLLGVAAALALGGSAFAEGMSGLADSLGASRDGRTTATGERYDMYRLTASSAHLPLNSLAEVRNESTGETVVVRINDRPAEGSAAVITLSFAAARRLGVEGETMVSVRPATEEIVVVASQVEVPEGIAELEPPQTMREMLAGRKRKDLKVAWIVADPTPLEGL